MLLLCTTQGEGESRTFNFSSSPPTVKRSFHKTVRRGKGEEVIIKMIGILLPQSERHGNAAKSVSGYSVT